MQALTLHIGDVFGTSSPMALSRAINGIQWWNSRDSESKYSHSGIITSSLGETFEALWRTRYSTLESYVGKPIIIARNEHVDLKSRLDAIQHVVKRHDRQIYPFWRLPLQIIPPFAKYLSFRGHWCVCSELVAEYEFHAGLRHGQFTGTTPDVLADEWRNWRGWQSYEGILGYVHSTFYLKEKDNETTEE